MSHNNSGDRNGHHDADSLDARSGNTSNQPWGNTAANEDAWSWPSDLPDQRAPSPPRTARAAQSARSLYLDAASSIASAALPRPRPHYHRQLPPLSHTTPIASLTAALRGEDRRTPHEPSRDYHNPHRRTAAETWSRQAQLRESQAASNERRPSPPTTTEAGPSNSPTTPPTAAAPAESAAANMPRPGASSGRKRSRTTAAIVVDDSPQAKRPRKSNVAQVDLSQDEELEEEEEDETMTAEQELLEKQRQEQVKRQREESGKPVRINDLTCMICLERFTNMTVTHCGHIFCHECLTQPLNASERNSERHVGSCPACRKTIKRGGTTKNQMIPLALMMKPKHKPVQEKAGTRRGSRRHSKTVVDFDEA